MAVSKNKIVRQAENPKGKKICKGGDPTRFYEQHPAWNFASCDKEKWSLLSDENVHRIFWSDIFPHFQAWEMQTWSDILVSAKKQNHSINTEGINKCAFDRLMELHIEAESLISLRLNGTHRIYGFMNGRVFNILWGDLEHGDNKECVCRSIKKHT